MAGDKLAESGGGLRSCIQQLDVKRIRYFYGLADSPVDMLAANGWTGWIKDGLRPGF